MSRFGKEREEALETLQGMTKEEIIAWLSGEVAMLFRPPSKSRLLFSRYSAAADAVQARRERNILPEGTGKKLDEWRAKLSRAKDHKEFLAIAKGAQLYERAFKKWLDEIKAISKEEEKVDALYAEYEAQQKRESEARSARESSSGPHPNPPPSSSPGPSPQEQA